MMAELLETAGSNYVSQGREPGRPGMLLRIVKDYF